MQHFSPSIINRLKRAEGHLRKVIEMTENGSYCPDIIHQSQAVQAALGKVDNLILESHLKSCVLSEIPGGSKKRNELTDEIVAVFDKKNSK